MGVLAAVLSTPCTGPAIGAIIGLVALMPATLGITAFVGIGLGMAVPYLLLTTVPGLLERTPRSGRWTELVKIGLGLVLLAVGLGVLRGLGEARFEYAMWSALGLSAAVWFAASVVRRRGVGEPAGALWIVRLLILAAAVAAIVHYWPAESAGGANVLGQTAWQPYQPEVLADAAAKGRPVLLDFVSDACTNCRLMDSKVWPTPQAAAALEGFVLVKVNVSRSHLRPVGRQYDIRGEPTLIVLDGRGGVVHTFFPVPFYADPDAFAEAMRPIRQQLHLPPKATP
jgi:thiol:disulfide interchange protein DsbD